MLWVSGFGAYVLKTNNDYNALAYEGSGRGLHGSRLGLGSGFRSKMVSWVVDSKPPSSKLSPLSPPRILD